MIPLGARSTCVKGDAPIAGTYYHCIQGHRAGSLNGAGEKNSALRMHLGHGGGPK